MFGIDYDRSQETRVTRFEQANPDAVMQETENFFEKDSEASLKRSSKRSLTPKFIEEQQRHGILLSTGVCFRLERQ